MFNVASCIMVTPVSYHGGVSHKPVILAVGALTLSLGSIVFASPHFLAPPNIAVGEERLNICPIGGPRVCDDVGAGTASTGFGVGSMGLNSFKYFFMVGHALHGVGSSPFYTLGVAYLDENTPTSRTSIYIGIFYATSVLGPAMGFLLGGYFLSIYTDLNVDSNRLGISTVSSGWIGAWWLGFFGASIVAFVTALPVASFPKALPAETERNAPTDAGGGNQKNTDSRGRFSAPTKRSFVNHIKRLFCNGTYVCLTLAAASETMIASGLTGFATKIFITMFGLSSTQASGLLGAVSVPSACGGALLGGYIIARLPVKSSTIVRFCAILSLVPWFTIFVFMHSCQSTQHAATTLTALRHKSARLTAKDLEEPCNAHCNCSDALYDPVCGTDNLTYHSPCVAGCSTVKHLPHTQGMTTCISVTATQTYEHCTCINGPTVQASFDDDQPPTYYMAKRDPCIADCGLIFVYAAAIFIALFFTFLLIVPALTAMLRSLEEDIKSTGIGINYVFIRLLATNRKRCSRIYLLCSGAGTIPGPILFGYLIDTSCLLWEDRCGRWGSCAIYENAVMGMNIFQFMISVKSASIVFFFCASIVSSDERPQQDTRGTPSDSSGTSAPAP
ncbi:solute carrier organic anion transporter family member 4A1-like [Ixodes scapularis]|uniref:solute carrier organic anion transporter family member 4A1-like n=1 Tax=Ixodes scapularis TaxID=6945 RepID=UPI001AD7C0C4|nr:solute carrier organic anion transporter family member 4A1-like [Ixodes scapularis]